MTHSQTETHIYHIPKLTPYGYIRKSHGHRGELVIEIDDYEIFNLDPEFIFVEIDAIPVPFSVESMRGTPSHLICKLRRVEDQIDAEKLRGNRILLERNVHIVESETEDELNGLIGYKLIHPIDGVIGELMEIDDSTQNILLVVTPDKVSEEDAILLPLVEDWIENISIDDLTILYNCPRELLNL